MTRVRAAKSPTIWSSRSNDPPAEKPLPAPWMIAHAHVGIAVDGQPHVGELAVHVGADRVEPGSVHHHAEHAGGRAFELQARERGVRVGSGHARILFVMRRMVKFGVHGDAAGCALVTGAGRGLGRAHALALAAHGMRVVVNDLGADLDGRGIDAGRRVRWSRRSRRRVEWRWPTRPTSRHSRVGAAAVAAALDAFGRIDVVVNNAGFASGGVRWSDPVGRGARRACSRCTSRRRSAR